MFIVIENYLMLILIYEFEFFIYIFEGSICMEDVFFYLLGGFFFFVVFIDYV